MSETNANCPPSPDQLPASGRRSAPPCSLFSCVPWLTRRGLLPLARHGKRASRTRPDRRSTTRRSLWKKYALSNQTPRSKRTCGQFQCNTEQVLVCRKGRDTATHLEQRAERGTSGRVGGIVRSRASSIGWWSNAVPALIWKCLRVKPASAGQAGGTKSRRIYFQRTPRPSGPRRKPQPTRRNDSYRKP